MVIDPVYMIREESANTIIKLGESLFDAEWLERVVTTKLDELVRHERFMLRIQTIHMINQMRGHLTSNSAMRTFARHLFTLAVDPVPNIRFNTSKTVGTYYQHFDEDDKERARELLTRITENDSDFDAKFFAQRTLDEVSGRN